MSMKWRISTWRLPHHPVTRWPRNASATLRDSSQRAPADTALMGGHLRPRRHEADRPRRGSDEPQDLQGKILAEMRCGVAHGVLLALMEAHAPGNNGDHPPLGHAVHSIPAMVRAVGRDDGWGTVRRCVCRPPRG